MRVLTVDDSPVLQERLRKSLCTGSTGLEIRQAMTCAEAREIFPNYMPELIVLDIELPDGSGMSLLSEFRMKDPEVTIIMFTNYPSSEFRDRCLSLKADYFIDKLDLTTLVNTVSKHSMSN